mgnify:CR=1 FL=1
MDKKQILNILAKEATQAAKDQATATLAALSADDLRPLVVQNSLRRLQHRYKQKSKRLNPYG